MKEHEQQIMHTSFLDEKSQITEDRYAVSYVKKAYDSSSDDAHRAGNEHAFLIIQKPGIIYRADVKQRENATDFIVRTGQKEFVTFRGFRNACRDIIWGSSDKTDHPKEHLFQWTWLVSKAKAQELEDSIDLEAGPEEESKKIAILYNQLGEYHLLNEGNRTDLFKMLAQIGVVVNAGALVALAGYKVCKDPPEDMRNPQIAALFHKMIGLCAAYLGGGATMIFASEGTKAITDTLLPTDHFPRYHNCSTWALEKLRNLNIKRINDTITPGLLVSIIDKGAHMASLYVGDNEEAKKALEFYNRVLVRPNAPLIANLEDCAQDVIYSQEKANIRRALTAAATHVAPIMVTEVGKGATSCLSL